MNAILGAIHILWINLITDGLPAIALSIDPKDPEVMKYPPRDPKEGLFSRFWVFILFSALVDFCSDFIPYYWFTTTTHNEALSRTIAFTTIVFFEFFLAYQCRSETHNILAMGWKGFTENKTLFLAVVIGILLQIVIIYYPPLHAAFEVTSLTLEQFIFCVICGSSALLNSLVG
ncbi:hypothetical protein FJY84_00590 [Candidatus Bathyarchaeota archaeon]|nr:hypothetical protein [Candidatus Bathyarchaeota archaeon]